MWEKSKLVACTGIETNVNMNRKKKHNATLSPLLNWKLQRINNVRLFGLCIWLFFSIFSRSFFSVDCCVYVARGLFLLQNNYNISGFFSVHYWKPGKMYEFSLKLKWKTIYAFREIFMCSWIGFYANICGQVYSIGYCLHGIAYRVRIFFFLTEDSNNAN